MTEDQSRNPFLNIKSYGEPFRGHGGARSCDQPECTEAGEHRAPKSRANLVDNHLDVTQGDYYWFCRDHARAYNAAWDYFKGMSTDDIHRFQREVPAWHRPTWKRGKLGPTVETAKVQDPFDILKGQRPFAERPETANFGSGHRPLSTADRDALDCLGLDTTATKSDIKRAYKLLVKKYHPDANGGNRQSEDMFRKIGDAYRQLAGHWETRDPNRSPR